MSGVRASSGNGVPVGIALLDRSLTFLWCNDLIADLLPETRRWEDLVGRALEDIMPMSEALGVTDAIRRIAETGEPLHVTSHRVSAHEGRTVRASAYPLPTGDILLVTEHPL